ncbi:FAD dependent oxidoreductase [Biscogniauxia mediterranea]|nr:FAD dependent oxidoreductase [Biscogniauxia mediterranea]
MNLLATSTTTMMTMMMMMRRRCLLPLAATASRGPGEKLSLLLLPLRRSFSSTAPARADFTHVVIGAGVVGLATARALALARPDSTTLLLEQHAQPGTETSSRNSEVVHAGLYYGPGTLKTRLCVAGKRALYAFCERYGVPHARTGKWIVAQDDAERDALARLHASCSRDLGSAAPTRWVPDAEARRLEPAVRAAPDGVLESPSTGIVDSHALMLALRGHFEDAGGMTALRARVVGVEALGGDGRDGWRVAVRDPTSSSSPDSEEEDSTITASTLINCAGLGAADVHNLIVGPDSPRRARLYYAKGSYFSYGAATPRVSRLIYPVTLPGAGGLGTHLTLDLAGRLRFGPDVEWVTRPDDLAVRAADRLPRALADIRRYLPGVDARALAPDYAGIRPKLAPAGAVGSGKGFVDFYVRAEEGYRGWVNLLGIESPGLTSCLAIADYVVGLLYGSRGGEPEVRVD